MNKTVFSVALGSLLLAGSLSASANEQQKTNLSAGMAVDQGLSVVAELDNQYRFTVGNDGAAFDYIAVHRQLDETMPVSWYVGLGAWSEWDGEEFGPRLPIGLKWDVNDRIDVYGQIQPELDLYSGAELQVGGALGVTYSF